MVSCEIRVCETEDDRLTVEVSGVLDQDTVADLDSRLRELVDDSIRELVLRLQGLDYVSSAGIGALMDWNLRLGRQQGRLVLVGPTEKVGRILDLLGLTPVFNIVESEDEAPAKS